MIKFEAKKVIKNVKGSLSPYADMSSRIPKYKKKVLAEIKTICRSHQNKFDMQASQRSCRFDKNLKLIFLPSKFVIRYSIFCGSLFNPGHCGGQSNHQSLTFAY
jgi:hypothetical protein